MGLHACNFPRYEPTYKNKKEQQHSTKETSTEDASCCPIHNSNSVFFTNPIDRTELKRKNNNRLTRRRCAPRKL